jgi:hypothetical protein
VEQPLKYVMEREKERARAREREKEIYSVNTVYSEIFPKATLANSSLSCLINLLLSLAADTEKIIIGEESERLLVSVYIRAFIDILFRR